MRAFRIAYDGRPYRGFQRQPDVPTVEDALFSALADLGVTDEDPGTAHDRESGRAPDGDPGPIPPGYSAAGRTDAGVSALAQTVAFDAPDWCSPAAIDSALPAAIRAWAAADVDEGFHATHDAGEREYEYALHGPDLDDGRAREAASRLSGERDFHNLTPDRSGTVRDLSIDLRREGEFLVVSVRAGGFPRHLVRRLVSLVEAVGSGEEPRSIVDRVLSPEPLSGPEGIPTAPAYPLVLVRVDYDAAFEVDPDAVESARAVFADRRVEQATRARVAGRIAEGIPNASLEGGRAGRGVDGS